MTKRKSREEFIKDAISVHPNDGNTYEKVDYINNKKKVIITCPKHGDFAISPNSYLSGQGCAKCAKEKVANELKIKEDEFNKRIHDLHGDDYDTSRVVYKTALTKVDIICKEHGLFRMTPAHLFEGHGCPECAKIARRIKNSQTFEEFQHKANIIHKNKYSYNKGEYINNKTKITITCPIHGEFLQRPDDHLLGKGCPSCGHIQSKAEMEIYEHICSLMGEENVCHKDITVLDGLEIDIYVPSLKFGIEYNGLHWHSEEFGKDRNYHLNKTLKAEEKGIYLIQIFEDEWIEHKDLVIEKITHFLHKDSEKIKIGARKCNIGLIEKGEAESFLNKFHIQGFASSSLYYGAFYDNKLVGVMSFKEEAEGMWNLTRFTTDIEYSIPGLANKIFKYFTSHTNGIREVKTFLDRRWSHCSINVYDRMGFTLEKVERPDYRYVINNERRHKFGFRKDKLNRLYNLPLSMTEYEMTKKLGFYRIWDCGLFKYVWKPQNN